MSELPEFVTLPDVLETENLGFVSALISRRCPARAWRSTSRAGCAESFSRGLKKLPSVVVPEIYEAALLRGIKAAPRR